MVVRTATFVSGGTVSVKLFLEIFFNHSDLQPKSCRLSTKFLGKIHQNCVLRVQQIFPFSNSSSFQSCFRTLSEKFSTLRQKLLGRVLKIAFYMSRGTFWFKKWVFEKYTSFFIFGYWVKNVRLLGKTFRQVSHNCILGFEKRTLEKSLICRNFVNFFGYWAENYLAFSQNLFVRVAKPTFFLSKKTFCRKTFFKISFGSHFSGNCSEKCQVLEKVSKESRQNCLVGVKRNFLIRNMFFVKTPCSSFCDIELKNSTFRRNFSCRVVKTAF